MIDNKEKRIQYYDIAKGIGIIIVVIAHANGPFKNYITQMHMPFFFIISGLLYNDRKDFKVFLLDKTRSLYIPFVFWNVTVFLVKSVLINSKVTEILEGIIKVLLLLKSESEFLGATWFLASLFQVSVVYKIGDTLMIRVPRRRWYLALFFTTLAIIGFAYNFKYGVSRTMILGMFYSLGVLGKRIRIQSIRPWIAMSAFMIFVIIGSFGHVKMSKHEYWNPVLFSFEAILVSGALLRFSWTVSESVKGLSVGLSYFGRKSKDILIFHFIAFRLVIMLQLWLFGERLTLDNILSYYPYYVSEHGWWLVYVIIGLTIPILFCELLRKSRVGKVMLALHLL